jgi:hypothetical protein
MLAPPELWELSALPQMHHGIGNIVVAELAVSCKGDDAESSCSNNLECWDLSQLSE